MAAILCRPKWVKEATEGVSLHLASSPLHHSDVIMSVSDHQPHDCLLNRFKENIKPLRHWPLCGEFTSNRRPVTREMFPFDEFSWQLIFESGNSNLGHPVVQDMLAIIYDHFESPMQSRCLISHINFTTNPSPWTSPAHAKCNKTTLESHDDVRARKRLLAFCGENPPA